MMLDLLNLCSDEQDLAQVAGTYKSTRSIKRGDTATDQFGNVLSGDLGKSEIPILCQVTEQFVGAGGTVQAQLVHADDEDLSVNLVVLQETAAIPIATLAPGYQFRLGKHLPIGTTKAYWGFRYIIATTTQTAGKITAGVAGTLQTAPGM